jgi:hypothetical protein
MLGASLVQDRVEGGPSSEKNHSSVVLIKVGQNIVIKLLRWYLILWPLKLLVIASDVVYVFDVMKCNIPNTSVSVFSRLCYCAIFQITKKACGKKKILNNKTIE